MKKLIAIVLALTMVLSICGCAPAQNQTQTESQEPEQKKSPMILNADGSYGGSLDEALYGKGAPKNGEYDVADSAYYTVNNDYYNMVSTEERIIFPNFATYQQTMQDSSGLACLLMVLNYAGQDVNQKYTELELLKKYEEVNGTKVYGNGTTEEGLIALVNALGLGYTAENTGLEITSPTEELSQIKMKVFFRKAIEAGKFVFVRYQSPNGYGWKLVAGYDTLGNVKNTVTHSEADNFGDDVIIFADPNDGFDHRQDGFNTERAKDFIVWWRDREISGEVNDTFSYIVVDPNIDIEYKYEPVDETVKQTLYDLHLPLNPDGTYGCTRSSTLYGGISSGNGWFNHTESNYYKINDYYNMGSEGSRILLKNYTVLQQTMSSSCGICAVNSVLKYYGEEESYYDMELSYLKLYESTTGQTVKGKGTGTEGHHKTLTALGYTSEFARFYVSKKEDPVYSTYESYVQHFRSNLEAGRPIVVSTNMGSGHFLTVIGIDDMGTDYIYDDVVIIADSSDYWDGYQDGYNTYSAYKFYSQHTNSKYEISQANIVIYPKD